MRTTCRFAIILCLAIPASGIVTLRQNPSSTAPSEQQPPTIAPDSGTPTAAQPPIETAPTAAPSLSTPTPETIAAEPAVKKKASPTSATKRRKHPAQPAPGTPKKVIVREGGANEPAAQIAPGMTSEETARERQRAVEWLGSADGQLKQLAGRTLNAQQQETVGQIHHYMDSARSALKEGDVGRASTIAQKAHLLSDDLVKH